MGTAPPGAALVAVIPAGLVDLAERLPGFLTSTTRPVMRDAARYLGACEKRPLTVTERMPPSLALETGPGNRTAEETPTGACIISVQIAERLALVVRLPREAHPRSPEQATPGKAGRPIPRK